LTLNNFINKNKTVKTVIKLNLRINQLFKLSFALGFSYETITLLIPSLNYK